MLTLKHNPVRKLKCPQHPNQNYTNPLMLPASCLVCLAIQAAARAQAYLHEAIIMAESKIRDAQLMLRRRRAS